MKGMIGKKLSLDETMQNNMMFVKWLWVLLLQELEKHHNFICLVHFRYFQLKYYTLLKVKFTLDSKAMFFLLFCN